MILPLAWLYRISGSMEHRSMLFAVASDVLQAQHASGGVRIRLSLHLPPHDTLALSCRILFLCISQLTDRFKNFLGSLVFVTTAPLDPMTVNEE
jgi:hypothetical protein